MLETALLMLTGHLLGDFIFQPNWLLKIKRKTSGMAVHGLIHGALAALCLTPMTQAALFAVTVIVIAHFLMEVIKVHLLDEKLLWFVADQIVHGAVIVLLAVVWPNMASEGLVNRLPADFQSHIYATLVVLCGFVLGIPAGGILIKKLVDLLAPIPTTTTAASPPPSSSPPKAPELAPVPIPSSPPPSPITPTVPEAVPAPISKTETESTGGNAGMRNAGRYIGWLERALSITFMLIKHPEAIGFIFAAKSVLRFRDIQDPTDRHQAEYVIIGSLLSFGWAVMVALATRAALDHWLV